mmetsp:Transcript_35571/g.101293  ORF Transcript_35571/g.101293 Transcript_35571/m.101293 type:complete len:231 (-) Transcript_35571:87-779(-)
MLLRLVALWFGVLLCSRQPACAVRSERVAESETRVAPGARRRDGTAEARAATMTSERRSASAVEVRAQQATPTTRWSSSRPRDLTERRRWGQWHQNAAETLCRKKLWGAPVEPVDFFPKERITWQFVCWYGRIYAFYLRKSGDVQKFTLKPAPMGFASSGAEADGRAQEVERFRLSRRDDIDVLQHRVEVSIGDKTYPTPMEDLVPCGSVIRGKTLLCVDPLAEHQLTLE